MTNVTVIKDGENIYSIELDGHTGYGVEGEDIVCSGLSCVVQTAVLGIFSIAQVNAIFEVDEERGYLRLEIPKDISESQRDKCNVILQTALLGIADLHEGYSDFIELEVKEYVY